MKTLIRPASLALTTALTASMFLMPSMIPDAGAVDIKVRVKPAVKVQPKIEAPSPKVRLKVSAKPRVKVVAPKVQAKITAKPRVKIAAPKVRPYVKVAPKVKVQPRIELARPEIKIPTPVARPELKLKTPDIAPRIAAKPTPDFQIAPKLDGAAIAVVPVPRPAREAAGAAHAAEAAKAVRDLAGIETAAPDFGLPMPELERDVPSNADRLGKPEVERAGWTFGDAIGGATGIGGPADSHSRQAPKNPWAVTSDTVAAALGGVASDPGASAHQQNGVLTAKYENEGGAVWVTKIDTNPEAPDQNGVAVRNAESSVVYWTDGTQNTGRRTVYEDGYVVESRRIPIGDGRFSLHERGGYTRNAPGPRTQPTYTRNRVIEPDSVNELPNPDYVGGGNCWGIDCVLGGSRFEGFTLGDQLENSPNQVLPPAPEDATQYSGANGTPIMSQHDVLSTYFEDGRQGGEPVRLQDVCFHSEC